MDITKIPGQHTSSIAHRKTIEAGCTMRSVHNFGTGDNLVTIVFYAVSDGVSPMMFDNSGATKIQKLDEPGRRVKIDGRWYPLPNP